MSSKSPFPERSLYADLQMRDRQIRLIEITSTQPEIVCKLEVVSLADEPAYSALSYVWGDPEVTQCVLVNGKRVNVTTNLASALEHAPKHLEDAKAAPRLWADALCINQNDPDEKNHQVPFMKEIYSQAEIVICCLGAPAEKIHQAMDWVNVITRECSLAEDDEKVQDASGSLGLHNYCIKNDIGGRPGYIDRGPNGSTTMDSSGLSDDLEPSQNSPQECCEGQGRVSESDNLVWLSKYPSFYGSARHVQSGAEDLHDAFELPYWSRVWVFQEVALAKKPVFACGTRSISLASLHHLASWTQGRTDDTTIVKPQFMDVEQWVMLKYVSKRIYQTLEPRLEARRTAGHPLSSRMIERDEGIGPEPHWRIVSSLYASNPKDYFYGFLSLSSLNLVPDYSSNTPVGMVCRDFMVEYVRAFGQGLLGKTTSGELDLLVFVGIGHGWLEYPETPSWAPNFPGLRQEKAVGSPVFSSRRSRFEDLFPPSSEKARFVGTTLRDTAFTLDSIQVLGPTRHDICLPHGEDMPRGVYSWIVDFAMSRKEYVAGFHPLAALHLLLHFESFGRQGEPVASTPNMGKVADFVQWLKQRYHDEACQKPSDIDMDDPRPRTEYLNKLQGGFRVSDSRL